HPTTGKVLRTEKSIHERWLGISSEKEEETYSPFSSRLEWEISHWAVRERVTQSSFDRLLKIPQV
ncbi:hypothetical protein EV361DRAFT_771309, partial [Lentinula raphanica]